MDVSRIDCKYGAKSTLAQCLAICGPCLVQIAFGFELGLGTIIVDDLDYLPFEYQDEYIIYKTPGIKILHLWIASGSILSPLLLDRIGHKSCLMWTVVSCLAVQIVFRPFSEFRVISCYICLALIGLGVGFSTLPCLAYAGEVCEPKRRGSMIAAIHVFKNVGSAVLANIVILANMVNENNYHQGLKDAAQVVLCTSTLYSVLTMVIVYVMTPDSPVWLIGKGKMEDAQRNLSKLRGKISRDKCESEFQEMIAYSTAVNDLQPAAANDEHDLNYWRKFFGVLRPFCLITLYFFFANSAFRIPLPRELSKFTVYKIGDSDSVYNWTTILTTFIPMAGGITTIFLVHKLGKRFLTVLTLSIWSVGYISIGLIGVYMTNYSETISSWILLIVYYFCRLISSVGIEPLGWILLAEIFSVKSRDITLSLNSASYYIIGYLMSEYGQNLSDLIGVYNVFTAFGVGGLFGCAYFYFCLPETENKTLREISEFFK